MDNLLFPGSVTQHILIVSCYINSYSNATASLTCNAISLKLMDTL